jgi:serine/threonine-protein kinase
MASVWIARQTGKHGFEKFVAVKTVLPQFASDVRFQAMFQDEARIASRIEHTNVAQILDVGEQQDITYLVMEYVDGESLSTVHRALEKKGAMIPPGIVLRVLSDVCGGLHAAHELREEDGTLLGVVHRDISPQNVLVNSKGVAKLIDFGIAKARDRVAGDTNAGQVKGKIRYMAPEQAVAGKVDRRADVWAIGAILYHLLSGKLPYDGENDVQALMVLMSGRPPVPLPPSVDPAVARVVEKALTASMDNRFATALELQEALEEAIVEAGLQTTATTVAAFLAEHVADRAKTRKETIAVGLKEAAERDRYEEIMRANLKVTGPSGTVGTTMLGTGEALGVPAEGGPHSKSGHGVGTGHGKHTGGTGAGGPPSLPGAGSAPAVGSAPGRGSMPGSAPRPGSGSHSVVTGGTLGSAAIDLSARRPSRGRTVAVVGVAAGAVMAIGGLVMMLSGPSVNPKSEKPATAVVGPAPTMPPPNQGGWTVPEAAPPVATAAAPSAAPSVAPNVPTIDANALRPATPARAAAPVSTYAAVQPRPVSAPVVPVATKKLASEPAKKKATDDGF